MGNTLNGQDANHYLQFLNMQGTADMSQIEGLSDAMDSKASISALNALSSMANGKENGITAGATTNYWRGDKSWQDLFAAVRLATLTGLSLAAATAVVAADTVLAALGKLQAQVAARPVIAYFNSTGPTDAPVKRWQGLVSVTSGNGFIVDISSAGFSSITSYSVTPLRNIATALGVPFAAVKSISNTQLVLNVVETQSTLVGLLGLTVNPVIFTSVPVQVSVKVEGN